MFDDFGNSIVDKPKVNDYKWEEIVNFLAKVNDELELVDSTGQRVRYLGYIIEAQITSWEITHTKFAHYRGRIVGEDINFSVVIEKNTDADKAFGTFLQKPIWIWAKDGEYVVEPSLYLKLRRP